MLQTAAAGRFAELKNDAARARSSHGSDRGACRARPHRAATAQSTDSGVASRRPQFELPLAMTTSLPNQSESGGGREPREPAAVARLLQLASQLGAAHRQKESSLHGLLDERLEQNDDGSLTEAAIERLRRREQELVDAREYRQAALVKDLGDVLGPQPAPLTLADCSPPALEDQIEFFIDNGFIVVPGLCEGDELARLQAAWMRAEAPERARWDDARAEKLRLHGDLARAADADTPVAHFRGNEGTGRLLPNGTAPYDNGRSYPQSTFDLGGLLAEDDGAPACLLPACCLLPKLPVVRLPVVRLPSTPARGHTFSCADWESVPRYRTKEN